MNPVSWIEIPVTEMDRAIRFYHAVFGWELKAVTMGPLEMAWLPWDPSRPGSSGSLVKNEHYTPGSTGSLIYFSCQDVAVQAKRVEEAGGQLLRPKTQISPEIGFMALAVDTEGNRIAFHSHQ